MSKAIYTKKLGRSVADLARPRGTYKYYVMEENSKWSVVSEGSVKALKVFATSDLAIEFAKEKAIRDTVEVVVVTRYGQIKQRLSYKKV